MPALVEAPAPPPLRDRWADLRVRVASAAVLAPVALACLWFGGYAWAALVIAAGGGMAVEWARLNRSAGRSPLKDDLLVAVPVVYAAIAALFWPAYGLQALALGFVGSWLFGLRVTLAVGVLYAGLGTLALLWLRDDGLAGFWNVLFLVLAVWASDISAYAVGRWWGGAKLAPRISPGKTWSGSVGGLAGAALAGLALAVAAGVGSPARAVLIAAALAVIAQAGDLLESAIKRHFGVKDSSHIIPGHGGLLDRLDGFLTAGPAAVLLALWMGRGSVLWQ